MGVCILFYSKNQLLKFITSNEDICITGLYFCDLDNIQSKFVCKTYKLDDNEQLTEKHKFVTQLAGICNQASFKAPQIIHEQIIKNQNLDTTSSVNISNDYNATFKCCGSKQLGGFSDYCSVILINNSHFIQNDKNQETELIGYNWDLPKFDAETDCNTIVWSNRNNQLYNIGGYARKTVYKLSFDKKYNTNIDKDKNDEWKWEYMFEMSNDKAVPTVLLINDDLRDTQPLKMMVIGGYSTSSQYDRHVSLYDAEKYDYISLPLIKYGTFGSAVYYDKNANYVYHGGGEHARFDNAEHKDVEYLDMNANKWLSLPETKYEHCNGPVIWMDDMNKLLMASITSRKVESIDIRENKWRNQYELSDLFQVNMDKSFDGKSRLIF